MGSKQEGPKVTDYYMSLHYGVCSGPVNKLRRIFIGEKSVWSGAVTETSRVEIDEPDIFGGDEQEGGVAGRVEVLMGDPDQEMPINIADNRLGLTTDTCPAFRGIFSIFMYGIERDFFGQEIDEEGFWWGTNNPYLKPVWVEVTSILLTWYGAKAPIPRTIGEPPYDGYTVISSVTTNAQEKFDSFGSYNAYSERFDANIRLYSIPDNTLTTITGDGDVFSGLLLTIDGLVVSRYSGGNIRIYDLAGNLFSELTGTLGALNLNSTTIACDVSVGSDHFTIMYSSDGVNDFQYIRITNHTSFVQTATTDNPIFNDLSAGPEYAYGRASGTNVYLIVWTATPITSSSVAPAGLSANIANVAYDSLTDSVIIVCTDGSLFRYSPDLSTLIMSNTATGIGAVATDNNSNRRMCPGDGSIVIARQQSVSNEWHIWVFSTSTLDEIKHLESLSQDTWINPTHAYHLIKYNVLVPSVLMVQHASTWSQWAFPADDVADMNPSHIIYHALTNDDWGMAALPASIDEDSFIDAADTLYLEEFGLSMMWSQQATIEDLIRDVLSHINATLFVHPATGLLTLKLIRNDYDISPLPVLDRDNSRVVSFARKAWGDTVNEVVVSWTNPENENTETITLQDLGNISMQGGVVSTSKNYYGIRKPELAQTVAARDLAAESWPLATAQVEVDRTAWAYVPGGVVNLSDTEHGISQLIMRIGTVDYGKPGDPKIRLALVEDIFALAQAEFVDQAPRSIHESPEEEPDAIDFALPQTLTYFHAKKVADISGAEYPEVLAGMLAAEDGNDTRKFRLLGPIVDAAGNETAFANLGTRTIVARATLAGAIEAEASTVLSEDSSPVSWTAPTQGEGPKVGGFVLIGDGEETENELSLISAKSAGDYTLLRGVLDTVPHDWPAATPLWFFSNNSTIADLNSRSALDTISYKVLPITSLGTLPANQAVPIPITLTERPWLPTRPADVQVNGIGFGVVDVSQSSPADVVVTWALRNRLTEDTQVLAWDAAGVTEEAAQTTTIEVLKQSDRSVITTHASLTGETFNLPLTSFGSEPIGIVRVTSERDGFNSLQGHEITVVVADLLITVPSGNLVLSTTAPNVAVNVHATIAPPQGNLVLSSAAPTVGVNVHTSIAPPQGNLVLSSAAPSVVIGGLNIVWQGAAADGTNGTTYSFTSQPIGTAVSTREVIVSTAEQDNIGNDVAVSSVTIGGVAARFLARKRLGGGVVEFWSAVVPTGTTATITVVYASGVGSCAIGIWATDGAMAIYDTDGEYASHVANGANVTLTTVAGQYVLAAAWRNTNNDLVARNMTLQAMATLESGRYAMGDLLADGSTETVGFDTNGAGSSDGSSPYCAIVLGEDGAAAALDGTGASAAFSLSRFLLSNYQGPKYDDTGGAITQIYNQTLKGGNVTDGATSARRPAISTAGPNSIACADFDGSSDYLEGSSILNYLTTTSKFIVWSGIFDSITIAAGGSTAGHAAVADSTGRTGIYGYNDGADKAFAANFDGTVDNAGAAVTEGTAYVVTMRHDGTSVYVSINGAAEVSVASGTTSGVMGTLRFGYRGNGFFDGKMFECAIFSTVPSAPTRAAIVTDFMTHCGA